MVRFTDRREAGRRLGERLATEALHDPVVLGLPRGGVPVAAEVATALRAPLDVIIVRKLGVPFHRELAMGAIAEEGVRLLDEDLVARLRVPRDEVAAVEREERGLLEERVARLRRGRRRLPLVGRAAVIVDDGLATGATARAASLAARRLGAARVVVAAPVGPPDAARRVPEADEVVCLVEPREFHAVGAHYEQFEPTTDDEVIAVLEAAATSE